MDENLSYILDRLYEDSELDFEFRTRLPSIELWYEMTGIRCPDIEIYNEVFETALGEVKMKRRKGKHQSTIDDLVDRFIGKHYVKSVEKNVNYVMGECDILVEYTDRRTAYWEIKSNHSKKSFMTAVRQLMRWSQVMNSTNPNRNYYGIYVASDDFIAVLCKNGTMLQDMNYKTVRGVPYEKNNMLNY